MPVELMVEMKGGTKKYFYIPLDLTNNSKTNFMHPTKTLPYWSGAEKKYRVVVKDVKKGNVTGITLDPDGFIPDLKPSNNLFTPAGN